jgi:dTDP-4-amino-4,6-dideoxygalactose transaminase
MSQPRIYLSPPHLSGREQALVAEAIASNWISSVGPHLDLFEKWLAAAMQMSGALAVSSGTAALHLALRTLRLQPEDEVLCQSLTFCASANPIAYESALPVFIDSETKSWNLDPQLVEDELRDAATRGKLPRAIIAVDIFGQTADMEPILAIANRYDVPVIEDAAEALGSTYKEQPAGSRAWAAILSFNGNKIITTSGGGALCSNDPTLLSQAKFLSQQARDPAPHYEHSTIGFNYRMSNLLAAVGLGQLEVLEERVAARRRIAARYEELLGDLPGLQFMPEADFGRTNRWLTAVLIDPDEFGATREDVRMRLESQNIESRPVWKPLHLQPSFAGCRVRGGDVSERLFERGLCLPSGSAMTDADLKRVTNCVRSLAKRHVHTVRRAA